MFEPQSIHFVGIGGVGTGTLAVNLAKKGLAISGSDGKLYDPMKSVLSDANVRLIEGYDPQTADNLKVDLVIVGNVVTRNNSEARAWIQKGTPFISFPEAVRRFVIEDRKSVVVAGTHGKTTTAAWIAFLFQSLGMNPSYLIGGVPNDLPSGSAVGDGGGDAGNSGNGGVGSVSVIEGDEYDSAFFDKGPKFLHYHPHFLVLTSIEFDHADIYRDLDHVKMSFEKLVALLPGDGLCIARFDDPIVVEVAGESLCPVQSFGRGPNSMWRLENVVESADGIEFEIIYKRRSVGKFQTPLYGEHNLFNLMSGIICAVNLGMPMQRVVPIVSQFTGVRRRQQVLQKEPYWIVDDFAHHPTEVLATLNAVRNRHKTGKLFALFEPRSATARRNVHQAVYPKAFAPADEICISSPVRQNELDAELRFSADGLVGDLKAMGKSAQAFDSPDLIAQFVRDQVRPGDVVVVMSNGDFGKIQEKIRA